MSRQIIGTSFLFIFLCAFCGAMSTAQDITIGEIELDRNEWGSRRMFIQADNFKDDTVRLNILLHTIYPGHYLSGLDRLEIDTTVIMGPGDIDDITIPFEMHGSFGRVVTRVMIYWKFDNFVPQANIPDSTFQIINSMFIATGDAVEFAGKKHSIGPAYSVMEHFLMNYEYPRLVLFLMSRGETPENISAMFEADLDHTVDVIADLKEDGYFRNQDDPMAPSILATTEAEGYEIKPLINSMTEAFSGWYDKEGRKQMGKILAESGFDDYTAALPSVQLPILHSLFMDEWAGNPNGAGILGWADKTGDIKSANQTSWIVQGGEFFLPKLCMGVFDNNDMLHIGTFSPDPALPFDKAAIYNMRGLVDKEAGSIIEVEKEMMQTAVAKAGEAELGKVIAERIKSTIAETRKRLGTFKDYQEPYLADYIVRTILGNYFVKHKPADGVDCIKVRY